MGGIWEVDGAWMSDATRTWATRASLPVTRLRLIGLSPAGAPVAVSQHLQSSSSGLYRLSPWGCPAQDAGSNVCDTLAHSDTICLLRLVRQIFMRVFCGPESESDGCDVICVINVCPARYSLRHTTAPCSPHRRRLLLSRDG
ncbi:hypothetical protein J6590_069998 [Homalodisca vitripennis]|nr:hypothetical protein J6590_069998 [Homalodisca vitripennis]